MAINGTTNTVIGSIAFAPNSVLEGVAFDGSNGYLYVADTNADEIAVINVGATPTGRPGPADYVLVGGLGGIVAVAVAMMVLLQKKPKHAPVRAPIPPPPNSPPATT
jgi:DNA-binding beta-propeller fold protein YncE